jgi:hypothetical protein
VPVSQRDDSTDTLQDLTLARFSLLRIFTGYSVRLKRLVKASKLAPCIARHMHLTARDGGNAENAGAIFGPGM